MQTYKGDPVRAVLVDDESFFREMFVTIMSDEGVDFSVVTNSPQEAVKAAIDYSAQVILTEIELGNGNPLETISEVSSLREKTMVFTSRDTPHHLLSALNLGARGYLLKSSSRPELVTALRSVARGHAYISPAMTRVLLDRFSILPPAEASAEGAFPQLSEREVEVLRCIAIGMSNHEIASDLTLTVATVKSHVSSLLTKLGLRDRLQAGLLAHRKGLLSVDASDRFAVVRRQETAGGRRCA